MFDCPCADLSTIKYSSGRQAEPRPVVAFLLGDTNTDFQDMEHFPGEGRGAGERSNGTLELRFDLTTYAPVLAVVAGFTGFRASDYR